MIMALEGPLDAHVTGGQEPAPLPERIPAENGGAITSATEPNFFRDVMAPMPPCCRETLENATETIAAYATSLVEKAEKCLDEAHQAAVNGGDKQAYLLISISQSYFNMAKEVA